MCEGKTQEVLYQMYSHSDRKIHPPCNRQHTGVVTVAYPRPDREERLPGWDGAERQTKRFQDSDSLRTCVSYASMEIGSRTALNADYRLECTYKHQLIPILRTRPSEISFLFINFHPAHIWMLKYNTCMHSKSQFALVSREPHLLPLLAVVVLFNYLVYCYAVLTAFVS